MSLLEGILGLGPGVLILILIFTLCVYLYVKKSYETSAYELPPGPKPWPVVGNLPELYKNTHFFKLFLDYKKKYGDIFTIYVGFQPIVVLGSLESVREGLIQKQTEFAGRAPTFTGELLAGNKDIVFGQYGTVWKQQRKIAYTAMRKYASGTHLENLVSDSFSQLRHLLDAKAKSGEAFDPLSILSLFIYNIIAAMTFGKTYDLDDPFFVEIIELNEELVEVSGDALLADIWPTLKHIPTPGAKAMRDFVRVFNAHMDETLKEHQDTYSPENITDLTYHMIHVMKKMEEEEGKEAMAGLTFDHIRGILLDIFLAGTDTSRFTLAWTLIYLVNHPDIQKRAQEEIDDIIDDGDMVTVAHKSQLPYTDAILHEVTRIRTLLPLALPHETTEDTTLGGYKLKKGTAVWPFTWALHMDPEHWTEPEEFRPERFLDADGQQAARNSAWMPFSTGRRVCLGESVAKVELLLSLTYLLKRYNFKPPPGKQSIEPNIRNMATFVVPVPYELVVERRN